MFVLFCVLCALLVACAATGFVTVRRLTRRVADLQLEVEEQKAAAVRKASEVARRDLDLEMDKEWLQEESALLEEEKNALKEREEEIRRKEEAQKMDAYDLAEKEDFLNQAIRLLEEDQEDLDKAKAQFEKAKAKFEKAKQAKVRRPNSALYSVRFGVGMDWDGELCGYGHLGMVQWETSVLRRWDAGVGRT
ncbi:hypothetical protein BSKO_04154 [Bryopsis sp. KO-2023]|nr:hypothetical protein BSKO_04154 [Bryopsis sp. KO-2023]